MKIVQLTTDNREAFREYDKTMPWFGTAPEALLQGFAVMPDVEVHVVSCTKREMKVSPKKLADNIYFHSLVVPHIGWMRTGYQGCIRAVRRKLREIQPDIVHGQGSERDQNISAVFSGFPNVLTIHGNMRLVAQLHRAAPFTFLWCAALLENLVIPRSNGVVCITEYTRRAVAGLAKKTWILPNAVDQTFFNIVREPASALPRILCVATIDARKNQIALIHALESLQPEGKFEVLFVGGSGSENSYFQQFLELVKTRPWCSYEGFTGREKLRHYMASAAGLVLPSLEDNCPMTVLEAMACGVPVSAAKVGGVPELIQHGKTGLLFDPKDPAAMASAFRQLLEERDGTMAAQAKLEARKRFHPEIVAAGHLEIYREVLASR